MGKKSGSSVQKRQRELKRSEKAALKKERRLESKENRVEGERVATADDLAGYGYAEDDEEGDDEEGGTR